MATKQEKKRFKKEKLGAIIKLFLVCFTSTNGFWLSYLFLWWLIGLPMTWWASVITVVLGGLSASGLFHWIAWS